MDFKSGFVAIMGRPNAGKSTLLNAILGTKVSIVSPKPQTTRNNIIGIYNSEDCQIVFTDTPGINTANTKLDEYMQKVLKTQKMVLMQFYFVLMVAKELRKKTLNLLKVLRALKI